MSPQSPQFFQVMTPTSLYTNTHRHRALLLRQELKMAKTGNGRGFHASSWVFQGLRHYSKLSLGPMFSHWCQVGQPQVGISHFSHLFAVLLHLNCQFDILHPQHEQGRYRWEVGRQTKTTIRLLNAFLKKWMLSVHLFELPHAVHKPKHSAEYVFKVNTGQMSVLSWQWHKFELCCFLRRSKDPLPTSTPAWEMVRCYDVNLTIQKHLKDSDLLKSTSQVMHKSLWVTQS